MDYATFHWFDPTANQMFSVDVSGVLKPPTVGLSAAYDTACQLLFNLINVLPALENFHAATKMALYRTYKAIPVVKTQGDPNFNPGTDTHFNTLWLACQEGYQRSRLERDRVRDMIDALRGSYLPRLRLREDMVSSGESAPMSAYPPPASVSQVTIP